MDETIFSIYNQEEWKPLNEIPLLRRSFHVYYGNALDLCKLFQAYSNIDYVKHLADNPTEQLIFGMDLERRIHNWATGAKSLVDQTRYFIDNLDQAALAKEYAMYIKENLAEVPLCKFVQDLRNFCAHRELPLPSGTLSSNWKRTSDDGYGESQITSYLHLKTEQLLEWDKWTAPSKTYMNQCGDRIRLDHVVISYSQLISQLYRWLSNRYHELNSKKKD